MGKKSKQQLTQQIQTNSQKLQKHILSKNSTSLRLFLERKSLNYQLPLKAYQKFSQLIDDASNKGRLDNDFEFKLKQSQNLYQKTSLLFKNGSLRQRYGALLEDQSSTQQNRALQQLTQIQQRSLAQIKKFYSKKRVSNIYKYMLLGKIVRRNILNSLIRKRYLQQKLSGIITLIS